MPELPEVETTTNGIRPHLLAQQIANVVIRQPKLRWPIPQSITKLLKNQAITHVERRAKYILIGTQNGTMIIHLGMSGSLRILSTLSPIGKHDHVDITLKTNQILRFTDPRRFGAILWTENDPNQHPLLKDLGPEPLSELFSAHYLKEKANNKNTPIKAWIMDNKVVVGVGNIYATEALFAARLHPQTPVKKLSFAQWENLAAIIQAILQTAITKGGTTLKDFVDSTGKPGYFKQQLKVYGRAGLPCTICTTPLEAIKQHQRTTTFCKQCQRA